MIQLRVSVSGRLTTIDTAATQLSDLTLPLKVWNRYKRKDVQAVFDAGGPGWPARKDGSGGGRGEAAVKAHADKILETKLRAELRRAQRRHARGRGNESKSAATVARRYAVLKAFEAISAGHDVSAGGADPAVAKSVAGLRERHSRAMAKAAARPLGRVAASIRSRIAKSVVEIYSTIPWAKVHNEGGVAGNGAVEPERRFLDVTEKDIAVLLMLITAHVQGRGG